MAIENVICLVIDRLHAAYIGAYGNTWIETPTLDRLAAESFVFDRATIDTPDLTSQYRSLWLGMHVLCPTTEEHGPAPLAAQFSGSGRHTAFLTDSAEVGAHSLAASFDEQIVLGQDARGYTSDADALAESIDETHAAAFFASAIDWIASAREPYLLWLHTETLGRSWDAPLELRKQYVDEDDPAPSESARVPNYHLPEKFDPDELLTFTNAYAGQVTLVDQLLAALMEAIDTAKLRKNTLFLLFSPRGFPLGEHRRVGPCDEALYAELAHVPLMMRFPPDMNSNGRTHAIVQPADLPATILDARGLAIEGTCTGHGRSLLPVIRGESIRPFDRAFSTGPAEQRGVVTPAWSLRVSKSMAPMGTETDSNASDDTLPPHIELFAKPDDWFEVNEISDRCPEIAEKMQAEFERFAAACQSGEQVVTSTELDELASGLY